MADSPYIVDLTQQNFAELMEASFQVPVLVDFWASWCQPCQMLMPVLAALADEYQGKFILAKLNTEEEQELAMQFAIRSIPTIKLFRDGQPVDGFMGVQPEGQIRAMLDRHVARESDVEVDDAMDLLQAGNTDAAIARLNRALEADPDNTRITLALAEAQAVSGNVDAAAATLDSLPAGERDKPAVATLRNRLFFAGQIANAPEAAALESRLADNADDHEARLKLALRKVVEGDYDAAMDLLLELMRKDRAYGDDAGRKSLLKVFDLLGDDPRVGLYRRRMASLLH